MSSIERYVGEVAAALRVRGRARRRFLRECRDHLTDAAAEHGAAEAIRAFGPARAIATAFDEEVAVRRGIRATVASTAGVVATGVSTLALIHGSDPKAAAPGWLAAAFLICAQVAAVAIALAAVQALALRRSVAHAADMSLLARRNACALIAAGATMFAAGAALTGRGSAPLLLAGPLLACLAVVQVLRARAFARRLDGARAPVLRPPLDDLASLSGLRLPSPSGAQLLAFTTVVAAAGAVIRDRGDEHATLGAAFVAGGIEALAVVAGFALLGPALGLRQR